MVAENLLDLLKCALRKSYQSQKIKSSSSKPPHFNSASLNSLHYSVALLLSHKLYCATCFLGCALAICSLQSSHFKGTNSAQEELACVLQYEAVLKSQHQVDQQHNFMLDIFSSYLQDFKVIFLSHISKDILLSFSHSLQ